MKDSWRLATQGWCPPAAHLPLQFLLSNTADSRIQAIALNMAAASNLKASSGVSVSLAQGKVALSSFLSRVPP
jgi:hypothetical protein